LERITERHKSGTRYEIDANGSKNETIVRDNYKLVVGHDTLEVFGNVRIIVSGQADIAVANDVNIAAGGNLTADVTGTVNITSTGDMTLKSDNIKLDGDVIVTGTTTTSETLELDTHTHNENNVLNGPTDEPN
jgi:CCR4-NOT transcriptional regulation complex NOT5 subunit